MRILVTGACGHIGTNVCIVASERNHTVVGMDNLVRPLSEENLSVLQEFGVKIVRGDVRNKEDFEKLPWVPEGIIHLAGQCGIPWSLEWPYYDFEVNVVGTMNVLEYARIHERIPVAFASTNKVYTNLLNDVPLKELKTRYEWKQSQEGWMEGITVDGINEGFPIDAFGEYARSPYGVSKVAADLYCQEYGQAFQVPTIVNRMSCIYGYYQKGVEDQGWVDWFLRSIAFGDGKINIFGDGKQVRDMLFATDVARLYVDEIEQANKIAGEVFNIGGGKEFTWSLLEAIDYIEKLTGKKADITYKDWRHADQKVVIMNLAKIKEKLGWQPTISPQQGILRMYKKYLEEKK